MKNKNIFILPALALFMAACEPSFDSEIDASTYTRGEADFTSYVAVGNSLTAGFMDGTVFRSSQQNSFPNILSRQFAVVGGGVFTQPSFSDDSNNLGGLLLGGNPIGATRLIINMSNSNPENLKGVPTVEVSNLQAKAYNNMGVPGAKVFHLLAKGYGNLAGVATQKANPYFVRHASSPNASVIEDAMSLKPTFFTNWIGGNDILSYATSGGTGKNQKGNLDPSTYGSDDLTDPNVFAASYGMIVNQLTSEGAKGVVATIPNVTAIPFFTTVPYNPLSPELLGGAQPIEALNQLMGLFKQVLTPLGGGDRLNLLSSTQSNPLMIFDQDLPDLGPGMKQVLTGLGLDQATVNFLGDTYGQARHATAKDLILLTAKAAIGSDPKVSIPPAYSQSLNKMGITYPLRDQHVLTQAEQLGVTEATLAFNTVIRNIAADKGLALADMNEIMNQLVSGLKVEDGQIYTADYFKGLSNLNVVMFSLDGVHPNARGYAFIANEVIRAINLKYKSKIPLVNPATYAGPTLLPSN